MKIEPREPQAPESYATFWEPLAAEPAPALPATQNTASEEAKDAYLEFVNVTEGVPAADRGE